MVVKDKQTVGIGPGQANRVIPAKIAWIMQKKRQRVLCWHRMLFPVSDWVEPAAASAGIKAVSTWRFYKRSESIDACNEKGIAMVFTGMRHFKH